MKKERHKSRETRIGVVDLIGHDAESDQVVLVMNEPSVWDDSDARLYELQERFNTYVSFLLDGELVETHPQLIGKRARIEVRCAHMPNPRALELLGMIHDQLEFQDITLEVVVPGSTGDCGSNCGCSRPP